jgi:DNA-directed RNA polymerase specialized sigma24 family protein
MLTEFPFCNMDQDANAPGPLPGSGRRREIQPEDFRRLLARLDPDPARASEAYEKLRAQLVAFFSRGQNYSEAEDLADRALDEVARKPDSYEIRNVTQFAVGVARFLQMEKSRRNSSTIHIVAGQDFPGTQGDSEVAALDRIDHARRVECFTKCVEALKREERWLVLEYYPADGFDLQERRRKLCQTLGIDPGTLTSRMNRLRAKLVKCCADCYQRRLKKP